jgi:glycosyltransferase 2 family protein
VRLIPNLLLSALAVGLIVWHFGGIAEVGHLLGRMDPTYAIAMVLVNTVDRALMTWKWLWLLASRGARLPFLRAMKIYCASMVVGTFLPASVGADAFRALAASRAGLEPATVLSSIVVERAVGLLAALLLALGGIGLVSGRVPLDVPAEAIWVPAVLALAGTALAVRFSASRTLFRWLHERLLRRATHCAAVHAARRLHEAYIACWRDRRTIGVLFGLTLLQQMLTIVNAAAAAAGLGIDVDHAYLAGAIPISMIVIRLPIAIDGIGIYEGALILLLSLAGVSAAEAVAMSLVTRVLGLASWLPWWTAYMLDSGRPHARRRGLAMRAE